MHSFMEPGPIERNKKSLSDGVAEDGSGVEQDSASAEMLTPHLLAATFILAMMTITLPAMWNTITAVVLATVQSAGPALLALAVAAGVCGSISYVMIWWLCERSSRAYYERVQKAARRAARQSKRHTHAA